MQDAATGEWVEPAPADPLGADASAPDPANGPGAHRGMGRAGYHRYRDRRRRAKMRSPIPPALSIPRRAHGPTRRRWILPLRRLRVDPASGEWVDPATVEDVAPAPVDALPVAPSLRRPRGAAGAPGLRRDRTLGRADRHRLHCRHTGGDGAPCLAAPRLGSRAAAVLGEGEAVEVRAETIGEWQPVNCAGAGGYVKTAHR